MPALEQIRTWPVDHAAAASVTRGGVVVSDASEGTDTSHVFELASVTKLLVAYGVLVAVEEGVVELDTPAGPEGSTVRHLLAHASGLAFDENRVVAPPATRRIYSSAGYEVLADLVGAESGIPFAEYLAEAVFVPLGMTSTTLAGPAGHGARSSVDDLVRFVGEVAAPRLLAPETVATATAVQFPGLNGIVPGYGMQKPCDWGLGPELRGHKSPHWTGARNSPATFGHFGQAGTFVWIDPVADVALVTLTDRAFGEWAKPLWPALSDAVLGDAGVQ